MVPEPTDPLLNVWRMHWNVHAILNGFYSFLHIFDANIFYPYPLTLAYSEHFILIALQALPYMLVSSSHLAGMNLSVLLTFVLSGYGMYLLVYVWTGQHWAGIIAGLIFAFSPQRFGQINHLELLTMQWMPFALLSLHWTLTRPGRRYAAIFAVFFNLQALSGFHYALILTIACVVLTVVYAVARRIRWRRELWVAGLIAIVVTLLLNWPIWRIYLRFSDVMGAVRTPGEVRVYSAAFTDYLTTLPHNWLYGWTFGRWQSIDHQFQVLMPFGIVGLLLAVVALYAGFRRQASVAIVGVMLIGLGFLLSFGLNEYALGETWSSFLKYSPYFWLYRHVPVFQGIRVPGRFALLVLLGSTILAGMGVAILVRQFARWHGSLLVGLALSGLVLVEAWSVPLNGPTIPTGEAVPPVYAWLARHTDARAVVLELPFSGASEFYYEYFSTYHWRRLANGGTGYTPPIYKEMRQWFKNFPDPRSVDVIQQLGIDFVILHSDAYSHEAWEKILAELPRYWPAVSQVYQVGNDLVLGIAPPACSAGSENIRVTVTPAELDGLPNAARVTYYNHSPAAFIADVRRVSQLEFTNNTVKNFTEPLVTPAGESQSAIVPLAKFQRLANLAGIRAASLGRTISPNEPAAIQTGILSGPVWQSLGLQFTNGPQLTAYAITPESPTACSLLTVGLKWSTGLPNDSVVVQLLDPFGRPVAEHTSRPWKREETTADVHPLPLPGSLPAGRYGIQVKVLDENGQARPFLTEQGVAIPPEQIPRLPVVVHPPTSPASGSGEGASIATFEHDIRLLAVNLTRRVVKSGDWLRFSLTWAVESAPDTDLTVFTQLLGPDGRVWGQYDNLPGGGWYRTSLWQPGRPVIEHYAFQLQSGAPPGEYRLLVGLYQSDTQTRLAVAGGGDFVEVGKIMVEK